MCSFIGIAVLIFLFVKKMISVKLVSILIVLVLIFGIAFYLITAMNFKSINLGKEVIGGIMIGQSVENKKNLVKDYEISEEDGSIVYTEKGKKDFSVTADKKGKVISILNASPNKKLTTFKGIKINDAFQLVVDTYGKEYKKLWFVEGYETGIQYQDKENDLLLEFYFNDDKLSLIELKKLSD